MEPCYMCQISDNDDYLSRSPCKCDVFPRIHLRCFVHVHNSICAACSTQMKPVVVNGKGRVVEFIDPEDSARYLQYFVNKNLYIHGILNIYDEGVRVAKHTYRDNKLDGQCVSYYRNGCIKKIEYFKDGLRHGQAKYFDHLGNSVASLL